jgi:hypothetical protein
MLLSVPVVGGMSSVMAARGRWAWMSATSSARA